MTRYNIPVFAEDDELEMDEVMDSIAWDLCGHTKTKSPKKAAPPSR